MTNEPVTNHRLRLARLACMLAMTGVVRAEPPLAVPVDGQPFRGELAAVDAKWQLTLSANGQKRTLPAAELVSWGACAEPVRAPIVVLADGGLLVADVSRLDKENLLVASDLFAALKLPLESLAGIIFHLPADREQRDLLLDRVAGAAGRSDRLLLDNGDELSGLVEAIDEGTVKLKADAGPLEIKTARMAALVLNPALRRATAASGLRAWCGFSDGSRLPAAQLLVDGPTLRVTTVPGQTWKAAAKDLVWLQPLGGRVVYLSDLKADGYRHVPFLSLAWPYHLDRNINGGRLRCGGRLYLKGLGVHSAARLTYQLQQPYRRFDAALGIDDSTAGGGSVRFRVLVDGREKYSSGTIRGEAPPVPVSVDLAGAKRLDLLVDYADRADELDHADWLDARLVR